MSEGAAQVIIQVSGMTCGACTSAVTSAVSQVPGVSSCDVSLMTERAVIQCSDTPVDALITAIEDSGFDAQLVKQTNNENEPEEYNLELKIEGMTCGSCSSTVRSAVEELDGVKSVEVSLPMDTAYIVYSGDPKEFPDAAINAIMDTGFDAALIRNVAKQTSKVKPTIGHDSSTLDLRIFGLMNNGERLTSHLSSIDGIHSVLLTGDILTVTYSQSKTGVRDLIKTIESLGFSALVAASADNTQQLNALNRVKELQAYYHNTLKSFILGTPVIIIQKFRGYMPNFITTKVARGLWIDDVIALALVIPLLWGPGRPFYIKSYKAIKARSPTMDVLVTTSVSCAMLYSILAVIMSIITNPAKHQLYLWDACAMILMFVLLGKFLENLARGQTSKALSDLISLVPEQCLVQAADLGPEGEMLATDMLQVNDTIILRPGERVAADGVVIDGESFISESLITGEAKPVRKVKGSSVVGGTINGLGTLKFTVTQCGSDTKLAQIINFIKEAQASRAPIQRYADMAAAKFVPTVMSLALATFLFWFISGCIFGVEKLPHIFQTQSLFLTCLRLGIAVVVVACPCALGLATPTAVMVATGVGAKYGILVKGGGTFESGSQAQVVLFDKTGTLTTGHMSVVSTTVKAEHWPLIRAIENFSEHPAGKALSNYTHHSETAEMSKPLETEHVLVVPGEGIQGTVTYEKTKHNIFVGRKPTFADSNIHLLVDDSDEGIVILKDTLKSDSPLVVEKLQSQGLTVGIVSGDSKSAVESIALETNIPFQYTWSGMKPQDKVEIVNSFKDQDMDVVFVGDGINDSPALVSASVGISLEGSTDVAVESADIVITQKSPISAVPDALDLCRSTMTRIKRNLFMSVIYNALMIPFAMGLLLHFHLMLSPMMASAAMALSSVSVVVSSLLLKLWRPKQLDENLDTQPRRRWWDWRTRSNQYSAVPV